MVLDCSSTVEWGTTMKLDPPAIFAFKQSAGGFGTPDTSTPGERRSSSAIALHNAIE